jgi:predicted TIM-barrel fold metal-dependent hydrolase
LTLHRRWRAYGNRNYAPIYDAAYGHGLAICIHFGGATGNATFSVGLPTYYFEGLLPSAQRAAIESLNALSFYGLS